MTTHETDRPVDYELIEEKDDQGGSDDRPDEQLDPGMDADGDVAEANIEEPVDDEPDTVWSREHDAVGEPELVETQEPDELARPDMAGEGDELDAVAADRTRESGPRDKLTPVGPDSAMDPGAGSYQDRWGAIQSGFIDDPRRAVESASALVLEIWDEIGRAMTDEREGIDDRWTTESSTDDFRGAMQNYRTLYTRFLRFMSD